MSDSSSGEVVADSTTSTFNNGSDSTRKSDGSHGTDSTAGTHKSDDTATNGFASTPPPYSLEAEQALLGALLIASNKLDRISTIISEGDFFEKIHRAIYATICKVHESGRAANAITVEPLLRNNKEFIAAGGMNYLTHLVAATPSISSAPDLARLIIELSTRRNLMDIGEEIVLGARDTATDQSPNELIESAEKLLYSIAEAGRYGGGFSQFKEVSRLAVSIAKEAREREGELAGVSTGLNDLDRILGGLQPSDLVILAGRPAMGKTALATNIAVSVALRCREQQEQIDPTQGGGARAAAEIGGVGFFSLEMSSEQLATRILSERARLSSADIRRGRIHNDEFSRLVDAAREIDTLPLYIDETGGLNIGQLSARARRLKRQRGLKLIIIDYVQLLSGSSRTQRGDSRVQEVTEITTGLKSLAKELNVPILVLSQLSRQVESREGNRPQLSDLRESGSIEQDADVVLFVFRREYYLERDKPDESNTEEFATWQKNMNRAHGKAEVIVGKQRHGPTGSVMLAFHAEHTRFGDLIDNDEDY